MENEGERVGIVLFVCILLLDPNVVYPGFLVDFLGNIGQKNHDNSQIGCLKFW